MENKTITIFLVFFALCTHANESIIYNPLPYSKYIASEFLNCNDISNNLQFKNPVFPYIEDYDTINNIIEDFISEDYNVWKIELKTNWNTLLRIAKSKGVNSLNTKYDNTYFSLDNDNGLLDGIIYTTFKFADKIIAIRTTVVFINNNWKIKRIDDDFYRIKIEDFKLDFEELNWKSTLDKNKNIFVDGKVQTKLIEPIQYNLTIPSLDSTSIKLLNAFIKNDYLTIQKQSIDASDFETYLKPDFIKSSKELNTEESISEFNYVIENGIHSEKLFFSKNKMENINKDFRDYHIDKNNIKYTTTSFEIQNFRNKNMYSNQLCAEAYLEFSSNDKSYKTRYIAMLINDKWKILYIQPTIFDNNDNAIAIATEAEALPKNGEEFEYYENGTVKSKFLYTNGILEGKSYSYFTSGSIQYIWNYINNKLEGEIKEFDNDGNLMVLWNYVNEKLEGTSKEFYTSGKIKYIQNFKNNELNGWQITYDENGDVLSKNYIK